MWRFGTGSNVIPGLALAAFLPFRERPEWSAKAGWFQSLRYRSFCLSISVVGCLDDTPEHGLSSL